MVLTLGLQRNSIVQLGFELMCRAEVIEFEGAVFVEVPDGVVDAAHEVVRPLGLLGCPVRRDRDTEASCHEGLLWLWRALAGLSPLTRVHKILYVQADIQGGGVGDKVARIYLRQRGTSAVQTLDGDSLYFRFPERTAVINPLFATTPSSAVDPEIYKNTHLRDRPFANTAWELIINQKDELANQDLDLAFVDDIKLYVYYTDFTVF